MALSDFKHDMQRCSRCSYCKWIPWRAMQDPEFATGCPSIREYHFHAYAAGGKWNMGLSLLEDKIEIDDDFLDALYRCNMDGACDVSCKAIQDIEPLQMMQELRIHAVQEGHALPEHMMVIEGLKREDNMMMQPREKRGDWAEGLDVRDLTRETADVVYHTGCRTSFTESLWETARNGVRILQQGGLSVGIMGRDEACCGGRAFEMGFEGELTKYAEHNLEAWKRAGVRAVVTPCADCYHAFKVLYDRIHKKPEIEVLHVVEVIDRMLQDGSLKLTKPVERTVTYHDPCHLGRLAEPWEHWEGKEVKALGQMICHDPPKKYRRGQHGVYDPPRNVLRAIPGLRLQEMHRTRDYAFCCGVGGGVREAYPEFMESTGQERLREAAAVGAEAIVSACPWCKKNFEDSCDRKADQTPPEALDIIDLVYQAL